MKITSLKHTIARLATLFWVAFAIASPSTLAAKGIPLPTIYAFNVAAEATINLGQTTELNWSVGDATEVTLSPDFGVVTGTRVQITPQVTTTYVLTAKNARGSVSKSKTITVIVPPVISSFTAVPDTITTGGSAKLAWSATGASWYQITADNGMDPGQFLTTSATVKPKTTTTYTLTANNTAGSATKMVTVKVVPVGVKPTISSFTASPATVTAGETTTLNWSVTNAVQLSIAPGVGVVAGSSIAIKPTTNTTYVLTATNPNGSVTKNVTVTVQPPLPPLPSIASFTASPASIVRGGSSALTWAVTGADGLTVTANTGTSPGTVTGTGTVVTPLTATVYTLTATNRAGGVSRTAAVAVTLPAPTIVAFTASPTNVLAGSPATLSWSATDAAHLSIAPGIGEVTGTSVTVTPSTNTTYVLTAVNDTGTASRSVTVTVGPSQPVAVNLFTDPQFETGVSDFFAQDDSSSVSRSTVAPLLGASSLKVSINGYGNNVWWIYGFNGGLASHFSVSLHARSDVASASTLQFCAMVYYADGSTDIQAVPVSGSVGDKGTISAALDIDPAKRLQSVDLRLFQEGSSPVSFTFDDAVALLDVIELPPSGGGSSGGGDSGGNGGGGGSIGCPPVEPGSSAYPGFQYQLPLLRPFISLTHYTQANQNSSTFARFRDAADQAVAGNPPYAYSGVSSVVMYRITGNSIYLNDAITRVERFVTDAEAAIAAGNTPDIAGDSYLDIGDFIEQLALAYDSGFDVLTPSQRGRWEAFANQAIFNLWHPSEAAWGGKSQPWSGWSICDPGNNYHFHFLRASMLWALAIQDTDLIAFLQAEKFTRLTDYYLALPGGGSREGTGYGTALRDLFDDYITWKDSTGEDLSALTAHTRQTIDYWVHATVPTLDRFAPIGDQSRVSYPDLFDYQENLVHTAVVLSPGTPEARRGTWWLDNNSVQVAYAFNLLDDLLPLPDAPTVPTDLVYHATGAGVLFARSSWATNASWLAFMAGKYDQSHAHEDQGSFTFFKGDWLSVTANIWSHSGLHEETEAHNTLRFERADGSVIPQNTDDTLASSMTPTITNGGVNVAADLSNAFSAHTSLVRSWHRNLEYLGNTLRVSDSYDVASGVRAVFQVHVPVQPVLQADGSFVAGKLRIVPLQATTATVVAMPSPEFSQGYRLEFVSTAGPTFVVELQAQ